MLLEEGVKTQAAPFPPCGNVGQVAFVGSETFLAYSKQDRLVPRRPHVLSCGSYCVVPCVIGPGSGKVRMTTIFGSESCAMEVYAFRSIGFGCHSFRTCKTGAQKVQWMLVVVRVRPCSNIAKWGKEQGERQLEYRLEHHQWQTPAIALNDVSCCFASKNCQWTTPRMEVEIGHRSGAAGRGLPSLWFLWDDHTLVSVAWIRSKKIGKVHGSVWVLSVGP